MRDLYATRLQLVHVAGGDAFDVACDQALKWAWRVGGAVPDLADSPTGTARGGSDGEEVAVSWTSLGSREARALEVQLRHPDSSDSTMRWEASVTITKVGTSVVATIRLGLDATVYSLRPLRLSLRAPSLVPQLMSTPLRAYAGDMELEPGVRVLDANNAKALVRDELEAEGRALPVLVASSDVAMAVGTELARGMAGLIQVVRARDRSTDAALKVALQRSSFAVPVGGLRLFWPGFGTDEQVSRYPYWTSAQLRSGRGGQTIGQMMNLLAPISTARVPSDPGVLRARKVSLEERQRRQRDREDAQRSRARRQRESVKHARQEARRAADDDEALHLKERLAEVESLLELSERERDEAETRAIDAGAAELSAIEEADKYHDRVTFLETENGGLRTSIEALRRYEDLGEGDDGNETVPDSIESWEELAENLGDLEGPGFFLTDRARACATGKNRYPDPGAMWDGLRALERTGRAFNEMGADLGVRFAEFAQEQAGITVALSDQTYPNHWFELDGEQYSRRPHVKVDDAKSPNAVGRVYFAIDADGKRVIVDWFGTKEDRPETKKQTVRTSA